MPDPWIKHPTTLTGEIVDLLPLDKTHFEPLATLARDRRIWAFYAVDGTDSAKLVDAYATGLAEREKGTQYPFVIFHKGANAIIGSTRYLDLQPAHRKLEIGWTWLHPDYWATAVNLECKLLLLTHCFETLKASRVQLKTDENNVRSRKAIEKIGGQFEGVLRNDMIRDNQTKRNSAYYGLIEEEWPDLKPKLTALYEAKKQTLRAHPAQ
jgi:RimJ/RimL family protein N-acetyltransferase